MIRNVAAFLALTLGVFSSARAQAPSNRLAPPDGSGLHVYVLTFGAGDEVWELFGHNAIRIIDDNESGDYHDIAFNWGTFDPGDTLTFAWHFVQGRMIYSMGLTKGQQTVDGYGTQSHRSVRQQELNLTASQKLRLKRHLWEIAEDPKLSNYRYDYYLYNCSSRVRDELDDITGTRLAKITRGVPSGTTFRWHTDRLDAHTPWLYVALQGVLGHPVDKPIDRWAEMFLPEKLHDRLNEVTVEINGQTMPLVARDVLLHPGAGPAELAEPRVRWPSALMSGSLLAIALAVLARRARTMRAARWGFSLLSIAWLLLMGLGGFIIWWGWFMTDHVVARGNENVLHVSLLALPLIVLLPRLAFGHKRGGRLAIWLTVAVALVSFVGLLLKALPMFYQVNLVIIALCLPVHIALAYAAWVMRKPGALEPATATTPQLRGSRHISIAAK